MRSFHMILEKSLENLILLGQSPALSNFEELSFIIEQYREYDAQAEEKRQTFFQNNRTKLRKLSAKLTKKALHITEEENIEDKRF